jgi:hypothetical protein
MAAVIKVCGENLCYLAENIKRIKVKTIIGINYKCCT